MIILKAEVCGAVELYCIVSVFSYMVTAEFLELYVEQKACQLSQVSHKRTSFRSHRNSESRN